MSVKLIAKRRLAFRNGDDGTFLTVLPHEFATVPDWVKKDPLYTWALKDGTIEVAGEEAPKVDTAKAKK